MHLCASEGRTRKEPRETLKTRKQRECRKATGDCNTRGRPPLGSLHPAGMARRHHTSKKRRTTYESAPHTERALSHRKHTRQLLWTATGTTPASFSKMSSATARRPHLEETKRVRNRKSVMSFPGFLADFHGLRVGFQAYLAHEAVPCLLTCCCVRLCLQQVLMCFSLYIMHGSLIAAGGADSWIFG